MKLHGNARQAGRLSHALQSGQRGVTLVFLTLLALGAARTSSAAPSAQPAPAAADLLATPTGLTPEPKADPPPVPDQARPIGQVKPSPLSAQPGYHAVMAQQRSKFCQNASVKAGAKGGLAACKQSFDAGTGVGPMLMSAQPGCPVPGSPVQTYDAAGHVAYSQVFSVPAGAHLTVWTESMTQVGAPFATTVPDTLLYLLRCDDLRRVQRYYAAIQLRGLAISGDPGCECRSNAGRVSAQPVRRWRGLRWWSLPDRRVYSANNVQAPRRHLQQRQVQLRCRQRLLVGYLRRRVVLGTRLGHLRLRSERGLQLLAGAEPGRKSVHSATQRATRVRYKAVGWSNGATRG